MWRRLGLADLLEEKLGGLRHQVPMTRVAALIAVGRTVAPASELKTSRWWSTTALPELLGIAAEAVDEDRLYRCLDLVWPHKAAIEKHLQREGETLFGQRYTMLLYDLSSTCFEGRAEGVPKAKRGYSRDHRPDCLQICFGVVVTGEGWPTGYETFEGNIQDQQTLEGLLRKLQERHGAPRAVPEGEDPERVVEMDRGLLTDGNLTRLRAAHYGYILAERRGRAARWYWKRGQEKEWVVLRRDVEGRPEVEVQEAGRDGPDRLILVRSAGCQQKERGIHDRVLRRLKEDLEAMQATLQNGHLKDRDKIHERLGRLQERHGALWKWVKVAIGRTGTRGSLRAAVAGFAGHRRSHAPSGGGVLVENERSEAFGKRSLGGLHAAGGGGGGLPGDEARPVDPADLPPQGGSCGGTPVLLVPRVRVVLDAGTGAPQPRRPAHGPAIAGAAASGEARDDPLEDGRRPGATSEAGVEPNARDRAGPADA
jgi:hypothetical protein